MTLKDLVTLLGEQGINANLIDAPADGTAVAPVGVSFDNRTVKPGELFICKGAHFKPAYLVGALQAGATAYLCESARAGELEAAAPGAPHIVVDDIRRAMAYVSRAVYDTPPLDLRVIGITGTKGKSSAAYMLYKVMESAGEAIGILGTFLTDDGVEPPHQSELTTPEAPELWRTFRRVAGAGRPAIVMEVSSQGLKYDRVLGITYDLGFFLNFGSDHLGEGEHPTMEDYLASKLMIFDRCRHAVVNLGMDPAYVGAVLDAARAADCDLTTMEVVPAGEVSEADVWATDVEVSYKHTAFTLHMEDGAHRMELAIEGDFNVENALVAIIAARYLGVGMDVIADALRSITIPGRVQYVDFPNDLIIPVADFAHNQLSMRRLLEGFRRAHPTRQTVLVFGCPGNKAYNRRPEMAQVAALMADRIYLTEDDPGYEDPADICAELKRYILEANPTADVHVVPDRSEAIYEAIRDTEVPSVLALIGKGDDHFMKRGSVQVPWPSDPQMVAMAIERLGL